MVGDDICEAVDTRELSEGKEDFVDVREAVEGRAERAATLPGIISWLE